MPVQASILISTFLLYSSIGLNVNAIRSNSYLSIVNTSYPLDNQNNPLYTQKPPVYSPSQEEDLPTVLLSVFIEQPTPFLEEFLQQLLDLSYPQEKLHLFLRNNEPYHEELVDKFFKEHSDKYISAKRVKPSDFLNEAEARKLAT